MGCIADLVFYATAACMFAQVNYELTEREKAGTLGAPRGGGQAMTAPNCVEINQCVGCTDNSTLSHFSAMTRPSWLGRAARNRHRHAIEQASRRWRGGRAVKF